MSVFEIENGDHCLQSLLSSRDVKHLLDDDNYNCDDADNYDDGDNDRALDQVNTFMLYGITGINRIL